MGGPDDKNERAKAPIGEAVSWIEAALQAGLGRSGRARPDLARQALAGAPEKPHDHVEAWLEAVAAELHSNSVTLVPEDMVDAIAARILADPKTSLGAHAKIESETIQKLVRRG